MDTKLVNDIDKEKLNARIKAWRRKETDKIVNEVMQRDMFDNVLIEARPAWSMAFSMLICQVREQGNQEQFIWAISGDFPTDYLNSRAASEPREAARHFAMKWHLAADEADSPSELTELAERLFELVNDDTPWS